MPRQTLAALSWCLLISAAAVLIWEVHRSHEVTQPRFVITTTTVTATETTITAGPPAVRGETIPSQTGYSGNTSTHRFHRATCRYASCRNCTARFTTREEAIAAGYRPGGCCDP